MKKLSHCSFYVEVPHHYHTTPALKNSWRFWRQFTKIDRLMPPSGVCSFSWIFHIFHLKAKKLGFITTWPTNYGSTTTASSGGSRISWRYAKPIGGGVNLLFSQIFLRCARFPEVLQNFSEPRILWSSCSVVFPALTLKLPIQFTFYGS